MKSEERLLSDVIRAGGYEQFQRSVANDMIHELRRLKAARWRRAMLAMAACVPLIFAVIFWTRDTAPRSAGRAGELVIVRTEPLTAEMIVRTTPELQVVNSREGIQYVESASESVATVSDQELLELFGDRPVALVRVATGTKFISPETHDLF